MVDIAHARPEHRDEIARFMLRVFPRARWSLDGWRALVANRWGRPHDSYAVTVRDGDELVGVLGLVTAEHPTDQGIRITANMTSWYLLEPYRRQGLGQDMIALAGADPEITLTNFTSAKAAVPVVLSAGMAVLDCERLIWRPDPGGATLPVHRDPLALGDAIGAKDRRILTDHLGLDLVTCAVETPDGLCVVVLSVKKKHVDYITHEVFYISHRDRFARHARAIATSLLPATAAVLSVDRRLVPADIEPDTTEPTVTPRFYTAGRLPPDQIDHLYSETVLVGMKLP